jgi:hypothetical protein
MNKPAKVVPAIGRYPLRAKTMQSKKTPAWRLNRLQVFCAIITLCAHGPVLAFLNPSSVNAQGPLQLDVKVEYKGGVDHEVLVSVTNKSDRSFHCLETDLPWWSVGSMTLVLVRSDGSRKQVDYERSGRIADPPYNLLEVKPGEDLKGTIKLTDRFANLEKVLSQAGIDVFWAYQLAGLNDQSSKRFGGWFEIPKFQKK